MKINPRHRQSCNRLAGGLMAAGLLGAVVGEAGAADPTWNVDNAGNWGTSSNWSGTVPDAAGATALLTYNITNSRTVTINTASRTVGILTIGDSDYTTSGSVWNSYTLAAVEGLSLIVDNGGSNAQINKTAKKYSTGVAASDTISAPVLLKSSLDIRNSGGASLYFTTGGITSNSAGAKVITNQGGGTGGVVISGVIGDGSGQVAVTQNSATSVLTLSGANTYTGATTVSAGTLVVGNALALQHSALDTTGTGVMTLSGVTTATLGGLGGSRNLATVITTGYSGLTALTLNPGAGASASYSGSIANGAAAMTLTLSGPGTQLLSGTNSYSGITSVTAGTLLVNGANTGSGAVNVSSGAILGGSGSVAGAINVSGVLSPGASIESFASGTLSMNTGSGFSCEVNSSATLGLGSDLQKVSGGLNLIGAVNLTLVDLAGGTAVAFAQGTTFSLINYSGSWNTGLFTHDGQLLADGASFASGLNTWQIDYHAAEGGSNFSGEYLGSTDSFVNLTAIPETRASLLGGIGLLFLLRRRNVCS